MLIRGVARSPAMLRLCVSYSQVCHILDADESVVNVSLGPRYTRQKKLEERQLVAANLLCRVWPAEHASKIQPKWHDDADRPAHE